MAPERADSPGLGSCRPHDNSARSADPTNADLETPLLQGDTDEEGREPNEDARVEQQHRSHLHAHQPRQASASDNTTYNSSYVSTSALTSGGY